MKKRSKKMTANVHSPSLSYIHFPFEVLRVITNDALCEPPSPPRQQCTLPRGPLLQHPTLVRSLGRKKGGSVR